MSLTVIELDLDTIPNTVSKYSQHSEKSLCGHLGLGIFLLGVGLPLSEVKSRSDMKFVTTAATGRNVKQNPVV